MITNFPQLQDVKKVCLCGVDHLREIKLTELKTGEAVGDAGGMTWRNKAQGESSARQLLLH